jgi:hypothetical protein
MGACNKSPSTTIAKEILHKEAILCPECFELTKFKKTNGIKDGIHYQMYFDAEIEFLRDSKTFRGPIDINLGIYSPISNLYKNIEQRDNGTTFNFMTDLKKGDRYQLIGIIYFIKTEKGWLPTKECLHLEDFKKL